MFHVNVSQEAPTRLSKGCKTVLDTAEPVAVVLAVEMNWASHPIVPSHPSQVSPARRHMLALVGFLAHSLSHSQTHLNDKWVETWRG